MEGTKFTDPELVAMAPNLMKEIASLQSEIDRLKNDLLDALDLKEGNGPTSLSMLKGEIDRLKEENKALIEALTTCSKEDDKYSYIVARCALKKLQSPALNNLT